MTGKRAAWGAALAAVVLFAAWMLWPRSLAAEFDAGRQFTALVTKSGVQSGELWMDNSERYDLEGSAALQEVLEGYSYHLCWDSLLGKNAIDGIGDLSVDLYTGEQDVRVFNGTEKLFCNDRVVRIYGGRRGAAALCEELLAVLRGT